MTALSNDKTPDVVLPSDPVLTFTPYAWAKLLWFLHHGDTEVGGFGITSEENPLAVYDFKTIKQEASTAYLELDEDAVSDYFETMAVAGLQPTNFARIWIHTHPGNSPAPSTTDEQNFHRAFGDAEWMVAFIIARDNSTYCRLRFNVGPGGSATIPTQLDYDTDFPAACHDDWEKEYDANVHKKVYTVAAADYTYTNYNLRDHRGTAGGNTTRQLAQINNHTEFKTPWWQQDEYEQTSGYDPSHRDDATATTTAASTAAHFQDDAERIVAITHHFRALNNDDQETIIDTLTDIQQEGAWNAERDAHLIDPDADTAAQPGTPD